MSKKKSTEEFIKDAIIVHGNRYNYSLVVYKGNKIPVCIICPVHGEFWQTPSNHLKGCNCFKCGQEETHKKQTMNKETFINKSIIKHGSIFDYSNVVYINNHTKVCIICPEHGEFYQTPNSHMSGDGCPKCRNYKISKNLRSNTEEFIIKAILIHGDKYDYSEVKYINNRTKVCIICPIHGKFWQTPNSHIYNKKPQGCPKCSGKGKTTGELVNEFIVIHGDRYDYSKVEYKGVNEKICIICNKCKKEFWQLPSYHLSGCGCNRCNFSKLEITVENFLNKENIHFKAQHKFSWLGRKTLDFYIPSYNIAIECQGKQHFKPVDIFGGEKEFNKIKKRDSVKHQLCKEHGIPIIYYNYNDRDLDKLLENIRSYGL